MSQPAWEYDPAEEVAEAFLARYRRGERPSLDEYDGWPGQVTVLGASLSPH